MATRTPLRKILAPDVRRRQLLDAATAVFARKGYRQAGIADVIARAGVARGTFYLYFSGKEQIFRAIVEDFHARLKQALVAFEAAPVGPAPNGQALLEAGFRGWLELFAAQRDAARVILREARAIDPRFDRGVAELRKTAVAHFAARLRTLQRAGAVSPEIDPVLVSHLQVGMFEETVNAFVIDGTRVDCAGLARQMAAFEWNGIRRRNGAGKDDAKT